ncbi:MAG: HipA family kinase [Bacteroidota bacterium]
MPLAIYPATRYVVPLREGGSLPAVLDTEGGLFVVKFRGAGQGARALTAELIGGGLAERLGLPMPEVALIDLDEGFGRTERDPEIQDILKGSRGLNVGLRYLERAHAYDPVAMADFVTPELAADLVWFDALITNIDRTPRNPNLLIWDRSLWLIDHGAALYFHHNWDVVDAERARAPFPPIKDHVLLPAAGDLQAADERLAPLLTPAVVREVLAAIPDALLQDAPPGQAPPFATAAENRAAYQAYVEARLQSPRAFVAEAQAAQQRLADAPTQALRYRR